MGCGAPLETAGDIEAGDREGEADHRRGEADHPRGEADDRHGEADARRRAAFECRRETCDYREWRIYGDGSDERHGK